MPATLTASVALDIGFGRGALVIYPAESYRGREIEISPVGADWRVHTGVHERGGDDGASLTAVFGSLPAGDYTIWREALVPGPVVTVPDGAVAEIELD